MNLAKEVKVLMQGASSYRGDCPVCGGKMSFSANRTVAGELAWICFKASCKVRGRGDVIRSVNEILQSLVAVGDSTLAKWESPNYFVSVGSRPNVHEYLANNNLAHAYKTGMIDLVYDPRQERVVFLIKDEGITYDAIGRLLGAGKPKWYRYGSSNMGCWFANQDATDTVIITEDIPSACVCAYNYNSLALLGTELSDMDFTRIIRGYSKVIVALDPDAFSKGVAIARRLKPYVEATPMLIPDDLKYFKPKDVKDMINEYGVTTTTLHI